MLSLVPIQGAQPAPAPADADAATTFVPGKLLNLPDQIQPARHVLAGACGDHAHRAGIGLLQARRSRGENCDCAPLTFQGEPQQRISTEDIALDLAECRKTGSRDGSTQQWFCKRPYLMHPSWIDADQLSRGWHRET